VAASLLNAIRLPELIAHSQEDYVQRAVDLAGNPASLLEIRRKLAAHRDTAPLFDTPLYTRHLESAYAAMHARHQAGLPPDHIDVA
jgi:predicted O-linked N-acetylglucosamine transferase (SPINDLY family)